MAKKNLLENVFLRKWFSQWTPLYIFPLIMTLRKLGYLRDENTISG